MISIRLATHDFVVSLTILGPASRSQELTTDFSPFLVFLEKSNSKKFCGAVGLVSNRYPAQPKENA